MKNINNTTNLNIRVNADLKQESDKLFKSLGLNMSTAINVFLTKCVKTASIPFTISEETPNKNLIHALKEAEYMEQHPDKFKGYNNVDELFEVLDSDREYNKD